MKLADAQSLALKLLEAMSPFCLRAEIAGSIRRGKSDVKDVEIVAVPKWEDRPGPDLFGTPVPTNLLYQWAFEQTIVEWIKPGTSEIEPWDVKASGKYWRGVFKGTETKLDLFIATPENWGVIFAIRTGSAEFSQALVTHAKVRTNYRVDGGFLKRNTEVIPCLEERDLFNRLYLEWVEPEQRTGASALRKMR